jgi:hypothetical protein
MKNLEEVERHFIEGARRAWSPSAHDEERVLLALDQRMADPSSTQSNLDAAQRTEPVPGVGEEVRRLSGSMLLSAIPRWVLAAVVLSGGAGSAGYALGFRAGARATSPLPANVAESAPVPVPSARQSGPRFGEPVGPPASDAPPKTSQPGVEEQAEPAAPRSSGPAREKRATPALDEEVRTLRRVERALRDQNPRLALALLDDLERTVPNGQLGMERFAASTLARCALGYGARSALLEDFSHRHPSSAYLARIRQECAAKPAERAERDKETTD